jgi:ubiquinone/menaquinone biosynthesis C-methylase UbiE
MIRGISFSVKSAPPLDKALHWWRTYKAKRYIPKHAIVCDLGCGEDGAFLHRISDHLDRGVGLDLSVKMSKHPRIDLVKADLNHHLPIGNRSVNVVTSLAVIEHLNEYTSHIEEAFRILAPGGILIVTTPAKHGDWLLRLLSKLKLIHGEEIEDHKRYFDKKSLLELCKHVGFKKVTYQRFQFGFNQLVVARA